MKISQRNTHMKAATLWAVLILGLLVAATAWSQPGKGQRGGNDRLIGYLELDEAQQVQWQEIHQAHREGAKESVEAARANRQALRELLESGEASAEQAGQLVLDGHSLKQDIEADHEELKQELSAVLTVEQLERFEAFQAASGDRGRRGPGPRRGNGRRGGRGGAVN